MLQIENAIKSLAQIFTNLQYRENEDSFNFSNPRISFNTKDRQNLFTIISVSNRNCYENPWLFSTSNINWGGEHGFEFLTLHSPFNILSRQYFFINFTIANEKCTQPFKILDRQNLCSNFLILNNDINKNSQHKFCLSATWKGRAQLYNEFLNFFPYSRNLSKINSNLIAIKNLVKFHP